MVIAQDMKIHTTFRTQQFLLCVASVLFYCCCRSFFSLIRSSRGFFVVVFNFFFWFLVFGCWLIAYSNFNAFKRVHILLGALIYLTNSLIKNRHKKRFFFFGFYFISNDRNQKRNEPKATAAKTVYNTKK